MKRNAVMIIAILVVLALASLVVQMTRYQIVDVNGRIWRGQTLGGAIVFESKYSELAN